MDADPVAKRENVANMVKNSRTKALTQQQKKGWNPSKKLKKKHMKPRLEEHLEQIPFQLRRIMKSRKEMNMGSNKLKKIMRANKLKAQTEICEQEHIKVPQFRRGKKESEGDYLRRMSQETQHVLFLTKNQPERHPEQMLEEKSRISNKDIKKTKWLHKKKVKQPNHEEKNICADKVQFGEVAMAPPSLTVKPKKAPVKPQGASSGLILCSILGHTDVSTTKPSMARQRIIEEEHQRVVHAYRQLKKIKRAKKQQKE